MPNTESTSDAAASAEPATRPAPAPDDASTRQPSQPSSTDPARTAQAREENRTPVAPSTQEKLPSPGAGPAPSPRARRRAARKEEPDGGESAASAGIKPASEPSQAPSSTAGPVPGATEPAASGPLPEPAQPAGRAAVAPSALNKPASTPGSQATVNSAPKLLAAPPAKEPTTSPVVAASKPFQPGQTSAPKAVPERSAQPIIVPASSPTIGEAKRDTGSTVPVQREKPEEAQPTPKPVSPPAAPETKPAAESPHKAEPAPPNVQVSTLDVQRSTIESSAISPPSPKAHAPEPPKKISEEEVVKELPVLQTAPRAPQKAVEAPPEPPPAPRVPAMFVVMITPELAPVAKVGGLADVVFGLSRELEARGNAVEIILPKYDCMRYDQIWGLNKAYEHLRVPWFNGAIDTTVWFGHVHGTKCFFIDPQSADNFFNRRSIYGHNDDLLRFAFFCRAALEFMLKTGKHPEILHCHDWQTALTPVLLYEIYKHQGMTHPRVCFTIHNFRHQGVTGDIVLRATGLNRPEHFFHYDRLRDNHNPRALNLAKGGIVYSNFVTTVSPRHAWEAKDGGQAHGLEPTLHIHHYKFGGVLNGLDYQIFNPESDPHIPSHYNAQSIEKKYDNKRALRHRLLLADNERPVVAFIGRLDPQKGLDLVRHAIFYALGNRAQFILLGESPDHSINDHFWGLKRHFNDVPDCHLEIGYNEELSHLIYAGADIMLVPSRFEPCGLTQLISMRYGTVPCVRSVGGLADTVFDKDYSNRPLHERNGYVFHQPDNPGLESALRRAIGCFYAFPDHFRQLMLNGMHTDYSWKGPVQHYLNIYNHIRDK